MDYPPMSLREAVVVVVDEMTAADHRTAWMSANEGSVFVFVTCRPETSAVAEKALREAGALCDLTLCMIATSQP